MTLVIYAGHEPFVYQGVLPLDLVIAELSRNHAAISWRLF
jgi:hypothetical protein